MLTDWGVGVNVGGGVFNFTNGDVNDLTDPGGAWTARVSLGTRRMITVEGAYIGTANNISSVGLDPDALLVANGVEGIVRGNLFSDFPVQPYIFGGVAWKHYSIVNEDFNTSAVRDTDDVVEIPFGLGVAYRISNFVLDGRADFRPAVDEDLVRPAFGETDEQMGLENWSVSARLGFEF